MVMANPWLKFMFSHSQTCCSSLAVTNPKPWKTPVPTTLRTKPRGSPDYRALYILKLPVPCSGKVGSQHEQLPNKCGFELPLVFTQQSLVYRSGFPIICISNSWSTDICRPCLQNFAPYIYLYHSLYPIAGWIWLAILLLVLSRKNQRSW